MQGELGPPRAGLFILPFAKKKKKHLVSSAPSLRRSSQGLSGGAASELQGRRGGVFSRPGPTGNNPPPGRCDAGEALTWKPDPATQMRSPAASLQKSLPRLHDWIFSPTPTAWSRSRNDNTEARRKSRPARLIGPHPKVDENHWATELLAKAPSQSHAESSCLLRSSSERCPVRGVAFLASWLVLSGRAGQGGASFWSEAEGSTFGGQRGMMAEGIGCGILPPAVRPTGVEAVGSEGDRTERPELAGLARSGCWAEASRGPAGGLPLGGPGFGVVSPLSCTALTRPAEEVWTRPHPFRTVSRQRSRWMGPRPTP